MPCRCDQREPRILVSWWSTCTLSCCALQVPLAGDYSASSIISPADEVSALLCLLGYLRQRALMSCAPVRTSWCWLLESLSQQTHLQWCMCPTNQQSYLSLACSLPLLPGYPGNVVGWGGEPHVIFPPTPLRAALWCGDRCSSSNFSRPPPNLLREQPCRKWISWAMFTWLVKETG